ncbi:MAG: acyltransferase [Alphaproteobacteria bacterium]|nr:acyltransferase [Alphaproteobacteria bacterium]
MHRQRFVVLDGLRGIAAFAVIADHVPSDLVRALIPGRYLAVDFFFILSGFVLCHAYGARLKSEIRTLGFLRLRFIRLYPLYLLGLMLGALHLIYLSAAGYIQVTLSGLTTMTAISLLFLPVPSGVSGQDLLYPLNPPSWSLFSELIANLAYAALAPWLSLRLLLAVLAVSGVAVLHLIPSEPDLGAGWKLSDIHIGIARAMFGFFAGVAIYRARSVFTVPSLPVWLAVGLLALILCAPVPDPARRWFDAVACLVLMPFIILIVQNARAAGRIAKISTWLGLVSYGVYVLHEPIYFWLRSLSGFLGVSGPFEVIDYPLVVCVSALSAWLATRIFDRPMRERLARIGKSEGAKAG